MLLRKFWRYFPVSPLFCTFTFTLEVELFPWTVTWSSLGVHWACVVVTGLVTAWDRIWPLSLAALWKAWWWLQSPFLQEQLLLSSPCQSCCTCCFILYLLTCLGFLSGFHLPSLTISLFLQQPLCKVTYTEQQHTLLEKKERNVPISLQITLGAFQWR